MVLFAGYVRYVRSVACLDCGGVFDHQLGEYMIELYYWLEAIIVSNIATLNHFLYILIPHWQWNSHR